MELVARHFYEFGPFRLDLSQRCLLREHELVPLPARAFDVLAVLVESGGRVVLKDALMDQVWAGSFVEESNLTVTISAVRRALGDSPSEPRYIETVPKRGYRFVAPVREVTVEKGALGAADVTVQERTRSHVVVEEEIATPAALPAGRARRVAISALAALAIALGALAYGGASESRRGEAPSDEAREAYLRGRYFWNKRSAAGVARSVTLFRRAIELDPDYALAYAGLADAYVFDLSDWPKAAETARKALELDPTLAAPHATLGFGLMFHEWDWEGAERELKLALERDPRYATAHQWYATWLATRGRLEEARRELGEARRLDPLSLSILADQAQLAYFERDYARAESLCREALDLDPDFVWAHIHLSKIYAHTGQPAELYAARRRADVLSGAPAEWLAALDESAPRGRDAMLRAAARHYESHPIAVAYAVAECYAHLGERDLALEWLERAADERNFYLVYMKVEPTFDGLRREPRFQEVARRVGL
jgi:DNA-binding winged helix-turn-helix (wHTH) protein/tetratricopeptide (TPR) repeat protein